MGLSASPMSKRLTLQQLLFRDVGQNGMVTEVLPLDVRVRACGGLCWFCCAGEGEGSGVSPASSFFLLFLHCSVNWLSSLVKQELPRLSATKPGRLPLRRGRTRSARPHWGEGGCL